MLFLTSGYHYDTFGRPVLNSRDQKLATDASLLVVGILREALSTTPPRKRAACVFPVAPKNHLPCIMGYINNASSSTCQTGLRQSRKRASRHYEEPIQQPRDHNEPVGFSTALSDVGGLWERVRTRNNKIVSLGFYS